MTTTGRLLIGFAVLAAAVGLVFVVRALNATPPPLAAPVPTQAPTDPPPPPKPKRFNVQVTKRSHATIDGTNLFGRRQDRRQGVLRNASNNAAKALEQYLNAAFVSPKTRFSNKPFRPFLTDDARRALSNRDRRALGARGPRIHGGKTVSAKARTTVLYRGSTAYAVTVRYTAKMNIILKPDQRPRRMTQAGTVVFKRTGRGWRADMLDVRLDLPKGAS